MTAVNRGRALRGLGLAVLILLSSATAVRATPPAGGADRPNQQAPLAETPKPTSPEVPEPPKKSWVVDGRGAFGDEIEITVPEFREITPKLSLSYDSSSGNGPFGVGWDLLGVNRIERAGAHKGAPRYDATDIFLVDGVELVPCAAGSAAPSCTTGGTHTTKTERYLRIALAGEGDASRWTVTSKDGTRRVFAPIVSAGTASPPVFRWGLNEVIDTSGNTVTYHWAAGQLDSVTYNGTAVEFHHEARPDVEQTATGNGGLFATPNRVKTIEVSVGGQRLRAYQLAYTTSGATARSLLTGVRQFGRDAVLDASGTVTGGTALPPVTAAYRPGDPVPAAGHHDTALVSNTESKYLPMDINGDGKGDMLEVYPYGFGHQRRSWLSDGTGFTLAATENATPSSTNSKFLPGDANADGKTDLIEIYPNGFAWGRRLWTSNGTGFTLASNGTSHGPQSDNSRFLPMDVNGDGKTDVLELYSCGFFPVHYCRATWLSDGTQFTLASHETGIPFSADRQFQPADLNGDGRTDLVEIYPVWGSTGGRRIWLSHGTGFTAGAVDTGINWTAPKADGAGSRYTVMDVNGDSKADMVELHPFFTTYTRRVWLSTGYGYTLASTDTAMPSANSAKHLPVDVNGDDRVDLVEVSPYGLSSRRRIWLSTGTGFTAGATDTAMGGFTCSDKGHCGTEFVDADVNGDGIAEVVEVHAIPFSLNRGRRVWSTGGAVPDVLTSRTNEWGGTTAVGYTPSTAWPNTGNPPITQTATSVTTDDGRGGTATTGYGYAGGRYDLLERRSLGFRSQKETHPCIAGETSCPTTETQYRQDLAALFEPERVERRGGDGALLTSTVHEYATAETVPRTAVRTATWEQVHSGPACPGADCRRKHTTRQYNAYGEVTREVEHGDADAPGDERTTVTTFVPNTAAYVVGKPASVAVFQGADATGTRLAETRTHYDGAAAWDQAPAAGLDTATARWLSDTGAFVTTGKERDAWGNVTAEINGVGARKSTAFDPVHHRFAISETNALGQRTTKDWDPVCGVPVRGTDLNGQVTTLAYDNLCRLVEKTEPGGRFERHTWADLGNAATQHELIERPAADGTADPLWTRRYLDGHQRLWRTVGKGPDAATGDVHTDTGYTARGQIAVTTAPYYWIAGQPQPATHPTTHGYDPLDRPARTTFPDGAYQSRTYGLWSVTSTDELGRAHTDRFDAQRRRIAREEPGGRTAVYAYDARGNLERSTDALGNTIAYTTDSLGRRTRMADPDSGTWTYEYDAAGRQTAQTDGKGQRTTYGYDALDRRTAKTSRAGTAEAVTVTWVHDEPRAGFFNTGKLTTTTDPAGSRTTDHDALGRVVRTVRTTGGTAYAFGYGFDAGDRLLWTSYPDGDTQGTAADPLRYDGAGRLTSIPGYVTAARYTADGKLTRIENANGTVTTRPHDPRRGWLTGVSTVSGPATVQDSGYTRNAKGLITGVGSPLPGESWAYAYDDADQLVSAANPADPALDQTLAYDAIGNTTANSRLGGYTADATRPHAVATAGPHAYTYDAAGLMTSGAGRTLTWDGDNRLASVTKAGVTSTFAYDAEGERVQQVDGAITRHYLGDDFETTPGGPATKYISIAGTLIARADGTTRLWVHTDHLGSVQALTDAAGAEVHRKRYRPQGEVLATTGSLGYEPRGFAGQRQDSTGLLYLHARYYDPELGRFISPDSIIDGEATIGLNRYAYAANNPVNNRDLTGLECQKSDSGKGGGGGGGNCKDESGIAAWIKAAQRKLTETKFDAVVENVLKYTLKVRVSPVSNLIVSAEKAWQDQSQAVDKLNEEYSRIHPIDPVRGGIYRVSTFVTSFAWNAADGAAFNIPGTIKYAMDYGQWRNFGRAEGKPEPNLTLPFVGQITGCRDGLLC
ncbi:RHS repeat-associated core domain-containing protein [Amycolatopsis magusensis]|uniref:RHS repeat-associated core domain-containing protein n=1 Tax=Amycolatopsis magusensis TaxID=882444 RepID=UPI0024A850CF|nr:RHS repeat-associated core domain-containing protein [Amycolatopsis magusensis]MDI5980668.1 RHS repeat-associated core domain-containing protein [Amycolatopsis magusensis]